MHRYTILLSKPDRWEWAVTQGDSIIREGWAITRRGALRTAKRVAEFHFRRENTPVEEVEVSF